VTHYMLDTNIISDLIKDPQGRAAQRIVNVGEDNICTSINIAAARPGGIRQTLPFPPSPRHRMELLPERSVDLCDPGSS